MATTTNFGWTTPDDTALVKDGASAIRTLGNSIDSSMGQLKGGTSGQILSKTSGTDMAFTWITPNPGDITAVNAGTGISGGGTSGDVTITNSMATALTTKGDLIGATGSGTFARLGVGSDGQVLTAASGQPTGLQWASPSSGSLTLLSTTSVSAVSAINITGFSQSYQHLYVVIDNVKPASNTYLNMELYYGAGTNMIWQQVEVAYNGTSPLTSSTIVGGDYALGHDWSATGGVGRNQVSFMIENYSSSINKSISGNFGYYGVTNGNYRVGMLGGSTITTGGANAINQLRFSWQSGANFSAQGTIYLYGVK